MKIKVMSMGIVFNTKNTKVRHHKELEELRTQREIPAVFLSLSPNTNTYDFCGFDGKIWIVRGEALTWLMLSLCA